MIKQLQLRGISRSPSDRMSEDGGLDESLNLYIDSAESAPVLVPEDVTGDLNLPDYVQAEKVFVHNVLSRKNYIVVDVNNCVIYKQQKEGLPAGEKIEDIAGLGNTLVISTDNNVYYFLYSHSDDRYSFLGNKVPFPAIEVKAVGVEEEEKTVARFSEITYGQPNQDMMMDPGGWNAYNVGGNSLSYARNVASALKAELEQIQQKAMATGRYWRPILVRYGVRLYNGSIITSVPFLLSPQRLGGYKSVRGVYWWSENAGADENDRPYNEEMLTITSVAGQYSPQIKMVGYNAEDIEKWKDIILGIEIYFSTQIQSSSEVLRVVNHSSGYDYASADLELFMPDKTDEELITEKGVFFKVASYDLQKEKDVKELLEGKILKAFKDEELIDPLDPSVDEMLPDNIIPKNMITFNNRIISSEVVKKLSTGAMTFMSEYKEGRDERWTMRFYTNGSSGKGEVLARDIAGNPYLQGDTAMGWIVYPSAQCYAADVCIGTRAKRIEMKPHPWLDCAYAFLGRNSLSFYCEENELLAGYIKSAKEKDEINEFGKLYASEMDNPMIFPVSGIHTISGGKVIGAAVATTTLSQGQFGQFPLYVFTEDGIWAMETAADGSLVTSKPLSRDVCVNPDSITSIDNAVVFVSDKGVMLLHGSQVVNISPFMNGRHYVIDEAAERLISNNEEYKGLVPAIKDETPFMAFMKKASIAYDYSDQRLICIDPDEEYQYIYKLDTQTWHKVAHGLDLKAVLNSYPECLVQGEKEVERPEFWLTESLYGNKREDVDRMIGAVVKNEQGQNSELFLDGKEGFFVGDEEEREEMDSQLQLLSVGYEVRNTVRNLTRIYDFSTVLDGSRPQSTEKGVIVTRPLELGYADVKKVIKDIRIRGQFAKGHVKYILQGSDDGVHYYSTQLKQKSWKLFRIIIVCSLDKYERISWIDIDFDIRYNNRLR